MKKYFLIVIIVFSNLVTTSSDCNKSTLQVYVDFNSEKSEILNYIENDLLDSLSKTEVLNSLNLFLDFALEYIEAGQSEDFEKISEMSEKMTKTVEAIDTEKFNQCLVYAQKDKEVRQALIKTFKKVMTIKLNSFVWPFWRKKEEKQLNK